MGAPRFFVGIALEPDLTGRTLALPQAVAHHAARVVRLAAGDALTLFDGTGGEYAATIVAAGRREVSVHIDRFDPVEREPALALTLAQAVAANDAMDDAVRKATELGAAAIQPVIAERSAPRPAGERRNRRHAHWRQVAIAACEQCGRNRVPAVHAPLPLRAWLAAWRAGGVVLAPDAEAPIGALGRAPSALLVGPEGGFAPAELGAARSAGFIAVRLGPRVLRTETAAAAGLAVLNVLWGDLR
jgi:16S rRNA (uracil1498-N3)-methyltransferase